MAKPFSMTLLVGLSLSLVCCHRSEAQAPERIILIVVDTLRRDHLSCYGGEIPTPNVDRLAARGQLFRNAVSSFHQTTMSMGALFTGRTPSLESGDRNKPLHWNGRTWCGMARLRADTGDQACLPEGLTTLGEAMHAAGYYTAAVVSNELLFRPAGFERGFSKWIELGVPSAEATLTMTEQAKIRSGSAVNRAAFELLERAPSGKLFLYIHYVDVHDWYLHEFSYAKAVSVFDAAFGVLLDGLESRGFLENTRIIFTSDHGEALKGETHALGTTPGHFGNPSYENLLRVPLIVAPPLAEEESRFIRSQDVHNLILRLANLSAEDSRDLEPDELFFTELVYQTYRKGRWKSMLGRGQENLSLFDLELDPGETEDVASDHPDTARSHLRRIEELARQLAAEGNQPSQLTPDDEGRLRALGYLK